MNNSKIFDDVVKMTEWVKYNKQGKKTISPRNEYLIEVTKKALQLNIGATMVISQQFTNKVFSYLGIDNLSHSYEKLNNDINKAQLLNILTSCNLFLEDRQITFYYNKLEQLTIQILKADTKAKYYYIHDTEFGMETSRKAINDLTGEEIGVETKTIKNVRPLITPEFVGNDKFSAEEMEEKAKKDLKEILLNLDNADLKTYLKPLVIVEKKNAKNA